MRSPLERKERGFDLLSGPYDLLARIFFGNSLQRAQVHFLPVTCPCEQVLLFGGGTGNLLVELMKKNTGKKITYVDLSGKMIAKAGKKLEGHLKKSNVQRVEVTFIKGSYSEIPELQYDLLITPFVLDCFNENELGPAMYSLGKKLKPGGKWLFTDFHVPQKGAMNRVSRIIIRSLYFFFNAVCQLGPKKLPAFERYFAENGLNVTKERYFLNGLLVTRIYARS